MPTRISRAAYADMYGPTTGDRVRLADTELIIEVERDLTTYGEEVKFGGGKVIRDGMGQSQAARAEGAVDTVITNALIVDWTGIYKADVGLRDGRIAGIGKAGNPDTPARRHHRHRPRHRGDRRRGPHPDRRRLRRPYPLHLPAADRRRPAFRHHDHARRRHRAGARHPRHHLHPRPLAHRPHAAGDRRRADEHRHLRQGQRLAARRAGGDGPRRRLRAEAARGLGHDAGRHRLLPPRRRRHRRAGDDPHRHAERVRASSRTPSPPSPAAPSTPSIPRAPAAATPPTSSRSAACRTSSRPRPTRPGPTRETPSRSTSTC